MLRIKDSFDILERLYKDGFNCKKISPQEEYISFEYDNKWLLVYEGGEMVVVIRRGDVDYITEVEAGDTDRVIELFREKTF